VQSGVPAAVDLVGEHQHKCQRDVFDRIAVQADHAQHLRIAAVAERHAQFHPMDGDVDAERNDDERQDCCIERGNRYRHRYDLPNECRGSRP
jgi:hypothetical protein